MITSHITIEAPVLAQSPKTVRSTSPSSVHGSPHRFFLHCSTFSFLAAASSSAFCFDDFLVSAPDLPPAAAALAAGFISPLPALPPPASLFLAVSSFLLAASASASAACSFKASLSAAA